MLSYRLHLRTSKILEKPLISFLKELARTSPKGSPSEMKGMNSLMTMYVAKGLLRSRMVFIHD